MPTLEADISSEESLFKYTFIATWQAPIHRSSPPTPRRPRGRLLWEAFLRQGELCSHSAGMSLAASSPTRLAVHRGLVDSLFSVF